MTKLGKPYTNDDLKKWYAAKQKPRVTIKTFKSSPYIFLVTVRRPRTAKGDKL